MAESEFGKDYAENVEEAKKEMGRIFDQARHMNRMIGQLLELTRLGNKRSVPLSPLDISAYVADIVTDYQKLPESRDITWDIQIEPNITVPTDQSLFMRIFINYLDNAMKFTRSRVKVCLYGKGNEVYLTVSDDGAGMDESTLKKIWDRLYQADASRSRKLNAGLGLAYPLWLRRQSSWTAGPMLKARLVWEAPFILFLRDRAVKKTVQEGSCAVFLVLGTAIHFLGGPM